MYCEEEGGLGLGALPATAYLVNTGAPASPLTDLRFQALRRAQAIMQEPAPIPISPTGQVPPPPPPPEPTTTLPRVCGSRTNPYPCDQPPPAPTPTTSGGGGPTYSPAIVPVPSFAPGGGAPVTVTVEAADAAAVPKGFGMVEAAIAAGVALMLGAVFSGKGRR